MSRLISDTSALLGSFPYALSRDHGKEKLAESIVKSIVETVVDSNQAKVLSRVDELPEDVLDMLAYDLKVDWYEPKAEIKYKRQAIKESLLVHRYKGTKYAVETALHSLFKSAEVQEWFEYGGEPFHFMVTVYGSTRAKLGKLYLKIQYAKNLRSVLDTVEFQLLPDGFFEIFYGIKNVSFVKRLKVVFADTSKSLFVANATCFMAVQLVLKTKTIRATLSDKRGD